MSPTADNNQACGLQTVCALNLVLSLQGNVIISVMWEIALLDEIFLNILGFSYKITSAYALSHLLCMF